MKTIEVANLKAECLALIDKLTVGSLVITKHGKPVARLVPYPRRSTDLIGILKGKIEVHGNIRSTGIEWAARTEP
jgi:prevent-host-death family protein